MTVPVRSIVNGHSGDALAITSRGLQYGDGLFETLAVVDGRPLLWARHWARLSEGCGRLDLAIPPADAIQAAITTLTAGAHVCAAKLLVARKGQGRGFRPTGSASDWMISVHPWTPPVRERQDGVLATWCAVRLATPNVCAGLKTLNRLEQVLAQREWQDPIREGLMQTRDGLVIEGTMSNVFIAESGGLVTPPLTDCGVAGVMRASVLEAAARDGIPVSIEPITQTRVERADELFLTNALIGIWPVSDLAGRTFSVGPLSQRLLAILHTQGDVAFS